MDIDFSSTDYAYIQECDTDKIATVLIKLADQNISDFYDDIEHCLYNLKLISQNHYNNDYYRKMLFLLSAIAEYNE